MKPVIIQQDIVTTSGVTVTLNLPSSPKEGRLLFFLLQKRQVGSITAPSGVNLIASSGKRAYCYAKVAGREEPTEFIFETGSSVNWDRCMVLELESRAINSIGTFSGRADTSAGTSITVPATPISVSKDSLVWTHSRFSAAVSNVSLTNGFVIYDDENSRATTATLDTDSDIAELDTLISWTTSTSSNHVMVEVLPRLFVITPQIEIVVTDTLSFAATCTHNSQWFAVTFPWALNAPSIEQIKAGVGGGIIESSSGSVSGDATIATDLTTTDARIRAAILVERDSDGAEDIEYFEMSVPAPSGKVRTIITDTTPTDGNPDAWLAETAYSANAYVQPTTPNGLRYEATTAGTSGASEPTPWPTTEGETVNDGTVVWTARAMPISLIPAGGQVDDVIEYPEQVRGSDGEWKTVEMDAAGAVPTILNANEDVGYTISSLRFWSQGTGWENLPDEVINGGGWVDSVPGTGIRSSLSATMRSRGTRGLASPRRF